MIHWILAFALTLVAMESRNGLEESIFLDPPVLSAIQSVEGHSILNAPLGEFPVEDESYDLIISHDIGCNLPEDGFSSHFAEMHRTLKKGGKAIVTAPASFEIVFTTGAEVKKKIFLALVGDPLKGIVKLKDVLRATFAEREGRIVLIEEEDELVEGERVWQKIPGLIVPNYYHSEESYVNEAEKVGFTIEKIERTKFHSFEEWRQYEGLLGIEYLYHHPFAVFHLRKSE